MKPVLVGLGTAVVLTVGGASATAAESPSPSPSQPGTTSPAPDGLAVDVRTEPAAPEAGDPVRVVATVTATGGAAAGVRIKGVGADPDEAALAGACEPPFTSDECAAGDLAAEDDHVFRWELTAPEQTTKVEITVTVGAANLDDVTGAATVAYTVPSPTPAPTPTPTPTRTTPQPSPTKTPSPTEEPPESPPADAPSTGGGSGGTSGGGGSGGGSGGTSGGGGAPAPDGEVVPPSPDASFDAGAPDVALPPVEAPSPAIAPGSGGPLTPQSRLQGNEAPVAQELTFERMASTQVAWLAALLVAISLLLTQARLGRRRALLAGAARRTRGVHRRPRRGLFGPSRREVFGRPRNDVRHRSRGNVHRTAHGYMVGRPRKRRFGRGGPAGR